MNLASRNPQVNSVLPADGWRPARPTHYSMDCIQRFPPRSCCLLCFLCRLCLDDGSFPPLSPLLHNL
jgi:hypothetical protein